jgi:hypothetical protein
MNNPAKVAQQAEMEDLLATQALKNKAAQSSKSKATNGDSEGEESEDLDAKAWDTINVYMKQLFKAHLINAKYDGHTHVFINPSNTTRYICWDSFPCCFSFSSVPVSVLCASHLSITCHTVSSLPESSVRGRSLSSSFHVPHHLALR